jgi:chromosome segregation ATPase
MSRTPLKDLSLNRPSVFFSQTHLSNDVKPLMRASVISQDIIQSRIEQLEREKVELSLQVHICEEKDRSRKSAMEQLETQAKNSDDARQALEKKLDAANVNLTAIQIERDRLENEVRKLTRQNENNGDSQSLWQKMTAASREKRRLEEEMKVVQAENEEIKQKNVKLSQELESMKERLSCHENELSELRSYRETTSAALLKLDILTVEHQAISGQLIASELARADLSENMSQEIEALKTENEKLKESIQKQKEENISLRKIVDSDPNKGLNFLSSGMTSDNMDSLNIPMNSDTEKYIKELLKKLHESENTRKKLHGQLQDLRGNVRVYLRCRPFLSSDGESGSAESSCIRFHPENASVSLVGTARGKQCDYFVSLYY